MRRRLSGCAPRLVAALVVIPWGAVAGCAGSGEAMQGELEAARAAAAPLRAAAGSEEPGLRWRLEEVAAGPERPAARAPARTRPLEPERAQALLERLPPLGERAEDTQPFARREDSPPPPQAGKQVAGSFPPPEASAAGAPAAAGGPLEVLRFAPEGEVPLAPHVSITFSQPMVPLGGLADLQGREPPARLRPAVPGRWEWLGTRTLLFRPEGERLPMATAYEVVVPAGVRSEAGGTLREEVRFGFRTPPPELQASYPAGDSVVRQPVIVLGFEQRVEPAAMLEHVRVRTGTWPLRTEHPVRLATQAELEREAERIGEELRDRLAAGRALALVPQVPLPLDTEVEVVLLAGAPSAEGPRRTEREQSFSFRTYGPLRVVRARCGWSGECRPGEPWWIELNNPLDQEHFQDSLVRVEPELPDMTVSVWGDTITVRGASRGRTRYTVTLDGAVRDVHGQTLGEPHRFTFETAPARPALFAPGGSFAVLDPAGPPAFSVYTINHRRLRVAVHAVEPEDWPQWLAYLDQLWREEASPVPPGERLREEVIEVAERPDALVETRIDLGDGFAEGRQHLVLVVEPLEQPAERWRRQSVRVWLQRTRIGLAAFADDRSMLAWASALADGSPLPGVELSILPDGGAPVRTGPDGTAWLELPAGGPRHVQRLLVARHGGETALLPASAYRSYGAQWSRQQPRDRVLWYVADDRRMYRPGESAHLKGWVRRLQGGLRGGLVPLGVEGARVRWRFVDAQGVELGKGEKPLGALGGFDLELPIPEQVNLGPATIELSVLGLAEAHGTHSRHQLQIQEFRRPEFEVGASASEGPHLVGGAAALTVEAKYYTGGPLAEAPVRWQLTARPASYTPPGREEFTFGTWVPWWRAGPTDETVRTEVREGRTDGWGRHRLRVELLGVAPPRPYVLEAEATVTDVNRQAWTANTQLLVHPAAHYVGIRSDRTFVSRGESFRLEAIACGIDGELLAGRSIALEAVRLRQRRERGRWIEEEVDRQRHELRSSAEGPVAWSFTPEQGGTWRVRARVVDDADRPNESELTLWVAGGEAVPARGLAEQELTLIPDRREYAPGETARLLVQSPFWPAEAVLTLRRAGLLSSRRLRLEGPSTAVEIPIGEEHVPNLHVAIDAVGAAPREGLGEKAPRRPAFASGAIELAVPPRRHELQLSVKPGAAELEPGGETAIELVVRDAAGRPVAGAEAAIAVVDEAVLALSGYRLPDPLQAFYPERPAGVEEQHLRSYVVLAELDERAAAQERAEMQRKLDAEGAVAAAPGAPLAKAAMTLERSERDRDGSGAAGAPAIRARVDLRPLALFAPAVRTDAEGRASVPLRVPDSLTRYRIMAVAAAGVHQYGRAEATLRVRLPLMVRPSLPRFLNYGDRCELPVLVHNQTAEPLAVELAMRASNLALPVPAGFEVQVPAGQRVEVRFPVETVAPGLARIQVAAASGRYADAAVQQLRIWSPASTEAFATYGVLDEGAVAYTVQAPAGVVPQFGGLEVQTSATQLQALTDAVLYLVEYPFECSEQIASRVLAIAALRDVLAAFGAEGLPAPERLLAAVERDLERLAALQGPDGGWGFWTSREESWPYVSIHVAHALGRARQKGFGVPARTVERALAYLRAIRDRLDPRWSAEVRWSLRAYACYARAQLGERDVQRARALLREAGLERLPLEAVGWLLSVLAGERTAAEEVARIVRHLHNRVEETAGSAPPS
ncbi:MAG: hypothetical protein KatS3mg102_2860 [Planctomycetota bacterium]|nr:MAG: hypothetical protein KatS3mg102_2860 [Planctomycetota bacterium]